jgi:hypothetical protein
MDLALLIRYGGPIVTSTCSNTLRCSLGSQKENAPVVHYEINGHEYNNCFYLADGIYREWSTLVNVILGPIEEKNKSFAKEQEACRKNVERTFGVL